MVLASIIKYDAVVMPVCDHLHHLYVLVLRCQDKMSRTMFPSSSSLTKHDELCCFFSQIHCVKTFVCMNERSSYGKYYLVIFFTLQPVNICVYCITQVVI